MNGPFAVPCVHAGMKASISLGWKRLLSVVTKTTYMPVMPQG